MRLRDLAKFFQFGSNAPIKLGSSNPATDDLLQFDGSEIVGKAVSGITNKKSAVFDMTGSGSSFSTGSLGFTPGLALSFSEQLASAARMAMGFAYGSAASEQRNTRWATGAVDVDDDEFVRQDVAGSATTWHITAFSSSGITVTRVSGTATMDETWLVVFEA